MVSSAGLLCLALNIFWEARSEDKEYGILAMAAPALVVMNRVKSLSTPTIYVTLLNKLRLGKGTRLRTSASSVGFVTERVTNQGTRNRGRGPNR